MKENLENLIIERSKRMFSAPQITAQVSATGRQVRNTLKRLMKQGKIAPLYQERSQKTGAIAWVWGTPQMKKAMIGDQKV